MDARPPAPEVLDQLVKALHRSGHVWREAVNRALEPVGLTVLQWVVVQLVAEQPGQRQTELAQRAGIEGPSLVRVLDELERTGWVRREACPDDRRAKRVQLAASGERRYGRALAAVQAVHARAVGSLSTEDQRELLRLIEAMSRSLLAS